MLWSDDYLIIMNKNKKSIKDTVKAFDDFKNKQLKSMK